jgi:hypothetical protein
MESSNNNNKNNGQGQQQPRKRKFNGLDNDGQPTAAEGGEQKQQRPSENLSKKKFVQHGNDHLEVCK